MPQYESFIFPNIPPDVNEYMVQHNKRMVVVGVIGKSSFPDCNKMAGMEVLTSYPSLIKSDCQEGRITFYLKRSEQILFLHFETTYDNYCMEKVLSNVAKQDNLNQFMMFNSFVRAQFARVLLFATQICHIVVLVETSTMFDASYLSLFKSLKTIREKHVLRFLPKFVKNSAAGSFLGKDARLCSPRFLFFFEKSPQEIENNDEALSKYEFEMEDNIYKMLRTEFIITNNSSASLFSIPNNKRFVYINNSQPVRADPLLKSVELLNEFIEKCNMKNDDEDELDSIRPYKGFGKPKCYYKDSSDTPEEVTKTRSFMKLLKDHVQEALQSGFDDSMSKFKGKTHFHIPKFKGWYDTFKLLHKIFIENPDNPEFEANDPDYKSYLENFHKIMDIDEEFFLKCCDTGLKKAIALYNNTLMTHYSSAIHLCLVDEALKLYMKYARGPHASINEKKIREKCEQTWRNGKQQCEYLSLRINPCVKPKHVATDPTEHSSGVKFISTCNCGRTQGRREDPYTIRQANYEFYEVLNCTSCNKLEKVHFAVFEPSINDYRAAEIETQFPKLPSTTAEEFTGVDNNSQPLTVSQGSHTNLSLESMDNLNKINCDSSDDSLNELVLKINEDSDEKEKLIYRQPSTTEYLPGMVHTESPAGLLPQFPSWSLVCLGPSSAYSHNTGLLEHFQSGFLSGANYLLPWDVHVRLEHSASWAAANSKARSSKKGQMFTLKIFVGCEYECPRGHRFIMSSPDKILRGGIIRDSGSKIVYNDMPLYFPCPCRTNHTMVAQLMRVHIVTPKAPVNVLIDPKVRTGSRNYVFSMGLPNPPKLSQSAYWVLRLPYIYQGDDGPIPPPTEVSASTCIKYGCLSAGMYGVSETEAEI